MTATLSATDLDYLRRTIEMSGRVRAAGKHPFAALVVDAEGRIVAEAGNDSLPPDGDPTRHAELLAAARAARLLTPAQLAEATLYSSAEPCAMCAGAIYWSGIGHTVFACSETRLGEIAGIGLNVPSRAVLQTGARIVTVIGPNLEQEAAEIHQEFWPKHLGKT